MKSNRIFPILGIFVILAFLLPAVSTATADNALVERAYCSFTTPANGATVSGTIDITISASKTPKLYLDGVYQGRGYAWTWDTTGAADGAHILRATAPGATAQITIYVDNGVAPPPVNEAPVVSITNPNNGATVGDTVTVSVDVDDEDTLTPDIYIDGSFVASATSFNWDTTAYADGVHTIYAEAVDSGDLSDSDSISVTVDNTVPPPPPPADGDEYFSGTVAYGTDQWHYVDAGIGLIDCELYNFVSDVDMYLYRPTDYTNYVVRAYTTSNPEVMSFTADETGMWGIKVVMYTSRATSAYDLHVTYTPTTPDVTNPVCDITDPVASEVVYKTKYIKATATDDRTVAYVEFFVDGSLIGTDSGAPFSYAWDTTAYADGGHTVGAIAYDGAGNSDAADAVSVTVDQSAAPLVDTVRYAVISGISDYKAISDLSYCDEDATDWYNYFISIGYAAENIWVFGDSHPSNYPKYDGYATEANVKAALENMIALADDDDIINFVTSGHGDGNGNWDSYLCMWDCMSGESGEDGSFYDYELAAILGTSVSKIHVFVDHCYSGGMGDDLMALSNAANIYCSTTCTEDGYGYDDSAHDNGMWTYWFVEAGLIGQYGSNADTTMEECFVWAAANYPKQPPSGDAPMEFDGDTGSPFIL